MEVVRSPRGAPDCPGDPPGQWRSAIGISDVEAAAARLRGVSALTPLQFNDRLSQRYGAEVYLKREDLQAVRSYKIRGAYNFIASLPQSVLGNGVVCASAGNHAQGVAWSCRRLGVRGTVFLPVRTPRQKIHRIKAFGGDLVDIEVTGETFDDALAAAYSWARKTGSSVVPGFDHPVTIAGQATVMLEVLDALGEPPDLVVVPVGGGGLVSGIALCLDGRGVLDRCKVVGVQPAGAPAMMKSLAANHLVRIEITDDFVDGAVVQTPGKLTFEMARELVAHWEAVDEGRVCTEQLELYQEEGIIAEPAGALALASLDQLGDRIARRRVVCILSGGNNDVARYGEIVERSLVHQGLKHYFVVQFPQRPGSLHEFLHKVLGPNDDITLFEYMKKSNRELGPALVGIELADRGDLGSLMERMASSGLQVEPVSPGSALFRFLL